MSLANATLYPLLDTQMLAAIAALRLSARPDQLNGIGSAWFYNDGKLQLVLTEDCRWLFGKRQPDNTWKRLVCRSAARNEFLNKENQPTPVGPDDAVVLELSLGVALKLLEGMRKKYERRR